MAAQDAAAGMEWKVPSHGMPSTAWPSIWPEPQLHLSWRAHCLVKVDGAFLMAGAGPGKILGSLPRLP